MINALAFPNFPSEIWGHLSRFLDLADIATLRSVCRFVSSAVDPLRSFALLHDLTADRVARYDSYYSRSLAAGHYKVAFFFALRLERFDDMVDLCLAEAPPGDHTHTSPCSTPTIGVSPALPPSGSPRGSISGPSAQIKVPLPTPSISSVSIQQALDASRKIPEFAGTAACYVVLHWCVRAQDGSGADGIQRCSRLDSLTQSLSSVMSILTYLMRLGADLDSHAGLALRVASLHGQLELATFLLANGAKPHHRDARALTWATAHGHLHILTPLLDALLSQNASIPLDSLWPPAVRARAFVNAAGSDHLPVLRWFSHNLPALPASTLTAALHQSALHGQADTVAHLLDCHPHLGTSFPATHLESVVERGHLSVLRTLIAHRLRIDPTALLYPAALKGRLNILLYLADTFRLDLASPRLASKTLCAALRGSHANVVEYLRDHLDAKLQPHDFEPAHAAAVQSSNAFALKWIHDHAEDCLRGGLAAMMDEDTLCEAVSDAARMGWAEGVAILVAAGTRLIAAWAASAEGSSPGSTPPSSFGGHSWNGDAGSAKSAPKGRKGFKGCIRQLRSQGWVLEVV